MKRRYIPIILFVISLLFLFSVRSVPPIEYWDEHWWIARGYFFELFIKGDFSNPAWKGYYSYDQPKLAEYTYGALLYPLYVKEKAVGQHETYYSFTDFLAEKNFYSVDATLSANTRGFIKWNINKPFSMQQALQQYGVQFQKTVDIILFGRTLSIVFLALCTVIVYLLGIYVLPTSAAIILAALFISNTVIVYGGVKATSEALFIFLFLGGLLSLVRLFAQKNPPISSVIFTSAIAALCAQTKLNGIMLVMVYLTLLVYSIMRGVFPIRYALRQLAMYAAFFIPVFIALHPFLYTNPIRNSIFLYQWRYSEAKANQREYSEAALRTPFERGKQIVSYYYYHVYTNYGMPYVFYQDRYIPYSIRPIFRLTRLLSFLRAIFALVGFISLWKSTSISVWKRNTSHTSLCPSETLAISTTLIIISVLFYLLIQWMPYSIPLTFPLLLFEVMGLTQCLRVLGHRFRPL